MSAMQGTKDSTDRTVFGKFWHAIDGGSECWLCDEGRYQDQQARSTYKDCFENSHSLTGTTNMLDCTCNAGNMPVGYEQNEPGCVACCLSNYEKDGMCQVCASGKFTNVESHRVCSVPLTRHTTPTSRVE